MFLAFDGNRCYWRRVIDLLLAGKMKSSGRVTMFIARDGQYVVMKGVETLYRGKDKAKAIKVFEENKSVPKN